MKPLYALALATLLLGLLALGAALRTTTHKGAWVAAASVLLAAAPISLVSQFQNEKDGH